MSPTPHPIHPEAAALRPRIEKELVEIAGDPGINPNNKVIFREITDAMQLLASEACWAAEADTIAKINRIILKDRGKYLEYHNLDGASAMFELHQRLAALQSSTEGKEEQ